MATKEELFGSKNKCFDSFTTDNDHRYSNLNLNQNNKSPTLIPVQAFNKSNSEKLCELRILMTKRMSVNYVKRGLQQHLYSTVSDKFEEKGKLEEWNRSSKISNFSFHNEKNKKPEKNETLSKNNSTLSLHISVYENSAETNLFKMDKTLKNSGLIKNKKNTEPFFTASKFIIQNPFEFPRQQNHDVQDPEVSEFKASQRLLNPNQASNNRRQHGAVKVPKLFSMADVSNDAEESRKRQRGPDDDDDMPNEVKKVKTEEAKATRKAKRVHFNEQVERKIIGKPPKASRRGKTTEDELYKSNAKNVDVDEEGREVIGKSNTHTLDSDEEEEKDHDVLDVRQLGGQEDRTVDFEGDTKITPFNMDDDLEEGHFDKSGNFIFDKKTEDLKDPWYDSVDWNKVQTTEDKDDEMDVAEEEELEQDTMANRLPVYQTIVEYLKDGETANDAMKRLNKSRVPIQEERKLRFAAKKAGQPYVDQVAEQIEKITASADILIKKGDTTVYEMTKENIQKIIDEAQKPNEETNDMDDETEIMWEYKLPNEDDSALKKASTKEMMELTENEQLPSDALVRRCGTDSFYTAGRVDFEIYLD